LALDELGYSRLQFDDFAGDGADRRGSQQRAAQCSREHGGTEK
jgi:hypothetical protein